MTCHKSSSSNMMHIVENTPEKKEQVSEVDQDRPPQVSVEEGKKKKGRFNFKIEIDDSNIN